MKRVGPNFAQLPINRPTCPFSNNQRDAESQQIIHKGRVAYFPNSLADGCPAHSPEGLKAFSSYAEKMEGAKVRVRSESFGDHFSQATLFWNSMAQWEKNHIVSAISFELNMVETMAVKERVVNELLVNVADGLAQKVAAHIGVKVTGKRKSKSHNDTSAALSMNKPCKDIVGRKVAILVAEGADASQVDAIKSALNSAGAMASVIAKRKAPVAGAKGKLIAVDQPAPNAASIAFDAVFVPSGTGSLASNPLAIAFIADHYHHGKPISLVGDASELLKAAIPNFESNNAESLGVIVSNANAAKDAATRLIAAMKQHRFPDRQLETTMA